MPRKKISGGVAEPKIDKTVTEISEVKKVEPEKAPIIETKSNNTVSFVKPQTAMPGAEKKKKPTPVRMPVRPAVNYAQTVVTEPIVGVLEIMQDGSGFVRPHFLPNGKDAFIASMQIRRYGLRAGDMIAGAAKKPKKKKK